MGAASSSTLTAEEIRGGLARLAPDVPWTHHFDLGGGIETITSEGDAKFYRKAVGLKRVTELALLTAGIFTGARTVAGLRVLDIASAEGGMSLACARAGAAEVMGVEGRELYVERSRFVARALGVANAQFVQADVRTLGVDRMGEFDFVIASGILHHLGQDDFWPFLRTIARLTRETLFLYTHVSTPEAIQDFRLKGPVTIDHGAVGYVFREHADDATPEQRLKRVRASLDNTFSFWATEDSLIKALVRIGFRMVTKVFHPHPFSDYVDQNRRAVLIARK